MRATLVASFVLVIGLLCPAMARAQQTGTDCNLSTTPVLDMMKNQIDPKVVQIRDAAFSYLIPGLVLIAIIATWTDYLRGRMKLKALFVRTAVVILLLHNYTGTNNFRDALKDGADSIATLVTANNNGVEAVFEALYQMFRSLECGQEGKIGATAAAVFMLLTTPAGILMVLFLVTSIVVGILSFVFEIGTSILLLVLDILGPLILPLGILASTTDIAWGWLYRYAEVCLWRVLYALFMIAISTVYQLVQAGVFAKLCAMLPSGSSVQLMAGGTSPIVADPIAVFGCLFGAMMIGVAIGLVSIFMLAKIPNLASGLVEGAGIGVNPMTELGANHSIAGEFRNVRRFGRGG